MILFPSTRSVPSSYIPSPVVVVVVLVHIPGAWHVEAAPCVPFFLAHPFNMHCTIQNSVLTGWKTANCTYQKVVEITQVQLAQTMGRQSVSQGQSPGQMKPTSIIPPLRDPTLTTLPCTFLCSKPWFLVLFFMEMSSMKTSSIDKVFFFSPVVPHCEGKKTLKTSANSFLWDRSTRNQSLEQSLKLINLEALFLKRGLQYGAYITLVKWKLWRC